MLPIGLLAANLVANSLHFKAGTFHEMSLCFWQGNGCNLQNLQILKILKICKLDCELFGDRKPFDFVCKHLLKSGI